MILLRMLFWKGSQEVAVFASEVTQMKHAIQDSRCALAIVPAGGQVVPSINQWTEQMVLDDLYSNENGAKTPSTIDPFSNFLPIANNVRIPLPIAETSRRMEMGPASEKAIIPFRLRHSVKLVRSSPNSGLCGLKSVRCS